MRVIGEPVHPAAAAPALQLRDLAGLELGPLEDEHDVCGCARQQPAEAGGQSAAEYALFTRPERSAADLLVIPSSPLPALSLDNLLEKRAGVLWVLPEVQATFNFAALVKVAEGAQQAS